MHHSLISFQKDMEAKASMHNSTYSPLWGRGGRPGKGLTAYSSKVRMKQIFAQKSNLPAELYNMVGTLLFERLGTNWHCYRIPGNFRKIKKALAPPAGRFLLVWIASTLINDSRYFQTLCGKSLAAWR